MPLAPLEEHIWTKISIRGEDECWPWLGYVHPKRGNPMLTYRGHTYLILRLVWKKYHGTITRGEVVKNGCRNKVCCNPRHLTKDTQANEARRQNRRGRAQRAASPMIETPVLYEEVRRDKRDDATIAAYYGINKSTVSNIKRGKVGVPPLPPPRPKK